jgi:hypothetical protein
MHPGLRELILAYQSAVGDAVARLVASGFKRPQYALDWALQRAPRGASRRLVGGVKYFKHSIGCSVALEPHQVDFDLETNGAIDRSDLYRLYKFSFQRLEDFGLPASQSLDTLFDDAVREGSVVRAGEQFHLAGHDAEPAPPGDRLPAALAATLVAALLGCG